MCGLVGLQCPEKLNSYDITYGLLKSLQHRGRDSWGMATTGWHKCGDGQLTYCSSSDKFLGSALGHIRYATHGGTGSDLSQPMAFQGFTLAMNGTLQDVAEAAANLEVTLHIEGRSDTELIGLVIEKYGVEDGLRLICEQVHGSFSCTPCYSGA